MATITIRNTLIKALHEHLQCPIVPTDTAARKPDYPYASYKITSTQNNETFWLEDETVPSINPVFEYDVLTTRFEQPQFTISFNTYSNDEEIAYNLAVKARDWFTFHGDLLFVDMSIVVVHASNISDRTQQIVDDFERRYGFDVRIRSARAISKRVETIEHHSLSVNFPAGNSPQASAFLPLHDGIVSAIGLRDAR